MSKNEKLAEFIVGATWESLPEAVRERSRMCLMDNLSATLSGGLARVSRIAADYAAGQNNYAAEQNYDTGQNIIGTPTIGTSAIDSPNIGAPSIGISSIGAPAIGTSTILLEGRKATPALAAFANASQPMLWTVTMAFVMPTDMPGPSCFPWHWHCPKPADSTVQSCWPP